MCCYQAQQILLVPSIRATCFSRTDNPQALEYVLFKVQYKMHICFKFVRSHKLYES